MTRGDDAEYLDGEHLPAHRTVRPYTITGGRTRTSGRELPFEAIVRAVHGASPSGSSERSAIISLATQQVVSLVEISAHLNLPFGVTRVLVSDLADAGLVTIGASLPATLAPAQDAHLLETVLDALTTL